ncbi:MAG: VCBS repeat-containing protein [Acidobacteria bacterium]|nr:VCBS repeat-containing protein [Acidobacteriota bacterium]
MRSLTCVLFALALPAAAEFRIQEIDRNLKVVYAVTTGDFNGDRKPDILVISPTQVIWYENPTWTRHVVADGVTEKDNVCIAVHDIDGDGRQDVALGASWQPTNTQSGGTLQWLRNVPSGAWPVHPIASEPTLHRIRWADIDGDGKRELIVSPLHGRGNKGPAWEGQGARTLVFRVPKDPARDPWPVETADDSLHIVHNVTTLNLDSDGQEEILTASREGVHALKRTHAGPWRRLKLGEGAPGEIKVGVVNRQRVIATVEPWHGNNLVVYEEPWPALNPQGAAPLNRRAGFPALWPRQVIDAKLDGGHALGWADFDGDGNEELVAGWRNKPDFGVAVYRRKPDGSWGGREMIDREMAAEDLTVADLNADGRPDIVAGGRLTENVRIYWNETNPKWIKRSIVNNFRTSTAIAADFTGDGKPDVISQADGEVVLFVAPDWKRQVLHRGANPIHSEVFDIDQDGDPDYIGAQYSPGWIFWLERPKNPLRDPWTYHLIDESKTGGVDGVHGLALGDIDGDGRLDVVGNSAQPRGSFPGSLAWFRNPGAGVRAAARWERNVFADRDAPGLSHYFGVGDVDGDGKADIASAAKIGVEGNWFAWWKQPAAGGRGPWPKQVIATGQPGATNIQVVDVNGDGRKDFLASRGHGFGLVWFEAPAWTPHEIDPRIAGPHSLAVGDIDGDGDTDAVTCAKDDFQVVWYENNGKGGFTAHPIWTDQAAYDIRLADMDGDGDLDVLVAGQESRNVVWFENRLKK